MNERGMRFLRSLSSDEEERVIYVRALVKDSVISDWARDTTIQIHRLAGSEQYEPNSFSDTTLLLTAIEENKTLLPIVSEDIEPETEDSSPNGIFATSGSDAKLLLPQPAVSRHGGCS
jgi:hypothetical protein